ncbi:NucA/NucB deoxyribonuclease domain-containing protein [Streptomyces massasporeus]
MRSSSLAGEYCNSRIPTLQQWANRNAACPSSLERLPGQQCDEYPFASTWQGAKSGGGDFSRRMINGQQNEEGGKALGRFYLYNRIIEKDKFLVWIK